MFITLEGADGSGKSTQIPALLTYLRDELGLDVLHTREPGGTPIGDQIRNVLHDLENTAMHPRTEVLLYIASRAQLVAQAVRPHLEKGGVVVSDRYADSTLAYQGYGHGLPLDMLQTILQFATQGLTPDLTLYFDIPAEVGIARRQKDAAQGGELNRMDSHNISFYERVCKGYEVLIAAAPQRFVRVDATQTPEHVAQQVRRNLAQHLA